MKPVRRPAPCNPGPEPAADCRCLCGNLLARMVPGGVELKCRRCKRTLLVPFEPEGSIAAAADVIDAGAVRRVG